MRLALFIKSYLFRYDYGTASRTNRRDGIVVVVVVAAADDDDADNVVDNVVVAVVVRKAVFVSACVVGDEGGLDIARDYRQTPRLLRLDTASSAL